MLPEAVEQGLERFVTAMKGSFGDSLRAVVLFGSAADETLRPASDVNVIVVLRRFDLDAVARARPAVEFERAAIRLAPMFLLERELPLAARAFAVKFGDVLRRRRVLHGDDPLVGITVPRAARIARLQQVLLNLALRMRETLVERGGREEQLAQAIAKAAGPLRSAAATLLELEARTPASAKQALATIAREFDSARSEKSLAEVSRARETLRVTPGTGAPTALFLIELALAMQARVEKLADGRAS